ncbi:DUF922 domain-containing protein [Chryseobacterium indologenes]|uniref:DUF922 domain-containing protein n=1 Tax=Chryseobacterium indologenes TaxID=253 RepID=A0A411DKV7_CHRID|nr:DUF922 domain-containing protein [Chryseobacterium indologenes]
MMYKLFIVFLLSSQTLLSQAIQWSTDRKLDFKDFAPPTHEEDNSTGAESYIGIDYKIVSNSIWTGKIKIKIDAIFYSEKSWVNKKYIANSHILNHEQKHFDIAHVFADKLQNIINSQIKGTKDYNDNFQKLYDENFVEYSAFQVRYDLETEHGANLEQQNKYNDIIESMVNDTLNEKEHKNSK